MLKLDYSKVLTFINRDELEKANNKINKIHKKLHDKTGAGNEFLGWLDLPVTENSLEIEKIIACAKELREISETLVVVGIGGSYLGSKAAIDFLKDYFTNSNFEIIYAGNQLSGSYYKKMLDYLLDKNFSVVVISKSGTTTEPAVAFRLLRKLLEEKYSPEEIKRRIKIVTDPNKGVLRGISSKEGYESFVIPENIGGRFSVLTACGLLPIACAGFDIKKILLGAKKAYQDFLKDDIHKNDCYMYAAIRNILYNKGNKIEIMVNYEPSLHSLTEWWKQLFGESEGKENKGLFVANTSFTTDLHSLGQYIQEGERNLFETVISVKNPKYDLNVPYDNDDSDNLNYLCGKTINEINDFARKGTTLAHVEGLVPNLFLELEELKEEEFGYIVYFFEKACAISAYLLDVNPFDQPGVEAYKNNMFALLGKKGYEDLRKKLDK